MASCICYSYVIETDKNAFFTALFNKHIRRNAQVSTDHLAIRIASKRNCRNASTFQSRCDRQSCRASTALAKTFTTGHRNGPASDWL